MECDMLLVTMFTYKVASLVTLFHRFVSSLSIYAIYFRKCNFEANWFCCVKDGEPCCTIGRGPLDTSLVLVLVEMISMLVRYLSLLLTYGSGFGRQIRSKESSVPGF